jgi:hypothetical protein
LIENDGDEIFIDQFIVCRLPVDDLMTTFIEKTCSAESSVARFGEISPFGKITLFG